MCDWSFQVLGDITMDEGIRSKKSLSLGMPMASQDIIQREAATKLGDARVASPLSSNDHRYFTRSYIFIRHILCVLLGASHMIWVFACFILCFKSSILAGHTYLGEPKLWHDLLKFLSMLHLNFYEQWTWSSVSLISFSAWCAWYFWRNALLPHLDLWES